VDTNLEGVKMSKLTIEKVTDELNILINKMGNIAEAVDHYIHLKRQNNANMENVIHLLSQYVNNACNADFAEEFDLHYFCACMMSRLSKVTKKMYGDDVWEKIFGNTEVPTEVWTDWTQVERKDFALSIQKKFISATSIDDYKRALEAISRTWVSDDGSVGTTKKDVTIEDVDAFIAEWNDSIAKDLKKNHESNDAVMAEFNLDKWKVRREGSKIIAAQHPFLKDKYVSQKDSKMKRYYACRCPWARASILKGETVSPLLCHCSLGYQKQGLETFFGRHLEGRILSSVLEEYVTQCTFEVDIPEDIME